MRAEVDAFDWAATPLGPRDDWCAELKTVVEQVLDSGFPKAVCWGPSLTTIYNDAFRPILGAKQGALGRSFADIWAEAWHEIGPIADLAMGGEATFIENFPLVINRNGAPEQAYFTFCYSPLRVADGSVGGMLDTVMETTATVEAQASLQVVNRELAHRLKNTLAAVQAIASQTLRKHTEAEAFHSFRERLQALSHAHDVLLAQSWKETSFRQAVSDSMKANIAMDRVAIAGPDLAIGSRTTMALSMMLHELGTNAAKYGAISQDSGRIDISWQIDGPDLRFTWVESGGPETHPPSRRGFGSRLIEYGLGGGSRTALSFEPRGLRMELAVPTADLAH